MDKIAAVVIACNEERNIERCLRSLEGVADETVVVDSGSTDGTVALCRAMGVEACFHEWEGFAAQKNFANSLVHQPWLLSLDADEALSDTLRESLLQLKQEGLRRDTVYELSRLTNYCGRWIRHCGWYPDAKLRLWPTGTAHWEGTIHEQLRFASPPARVERVRGDLLHYSYYTVEEHVKQADAFTTLTAREAYADGRRATMWDLVTRPRWKFVRDYLFKGGFLDGAAGYQVCKISAFATFLKYSKLRHLAQRDR